MFINFRNYSPTLLAKIKLVDPDLLCENFVTNKLNKK